MYTLDYEDHIKWTFSTWTYWSIEVWLQESRTI